MNSLDFQLRQLVKLFSATKIDYAVLGGVAVSIYGEPRLTLDIDINIILNMQDIDIFLNKAKEFGFLPLTKNIKNFIKATGVIPMRFSKRGVLGKCDFIIAGNALEYAGIKRAVFKKIYSNRLKLIRPEDLVLHKITSNRPRDIEDVRGILVRQKGKLDLNYINSWLKRIEKFNKQSKEPVLFKSLLDARI